MTADRPDARALIAMTLDEGSFASWDDRDPAQPDLGDEYAGQLAAARERTGLSESVVTGSGTLDGHPVAVIVGEFGFLAGSIGTVAADRITAAVRRATAERLPILAAPVSGGTRMQEGTAAFTRMVDITAAVVDHKRAGLLYLVYQRHPTTGGVFASWGSLGHITVAQPGALIGFLGPKVYEALHGAPFPPGVQSAENLLAHGLVDAVLEPRHLRTMVARVLAITSAGAASEGDGLGEEHPIADDGGEDATAPDAWEAVLVSRRAGRPGVRTLLRVAATDVVPLSGTSEGETEKASTVTLARLGGQGVVMIGLDRHAQSFDGPLGPGALRQARRGMALAAELGLPLVTVIDTPGAALSREAEEGGLGGEIARCLAALITLPVPTVSVIMGQGTGGAALALLPADRVVAAQYGWLSPLPPEGASIIRHGDVERAPEMARAQGITSRSLLDQGIIDAIVAERPTAELEPEEFCRRLGAAIRSQVALAQRADLDDPSGRTARRARRAHPAAPAAAPGPAAAPALAAAPAPAPAGELA